MSLAKAWRVEKVEGEATEVEDQFGMTDENEIKDHILVEEVTGRQRRDTWLDNHVLSDQAKSLSDRLPANSRA